MAAASNPERAEVQVLLGDLLRAEGQTSQALEHYRQALRSQPDLARAHLSTGVALVNSGQTDEGLQHLRRAAAGSDAEVRDAALDALRQLGLSRWLRRARASFRLDPLDRHQMGARIAQVVRHALPGGFRVAVGDRF